MDEEKRPPDDRDSTELPPTKTTHPGSHAGERIGPYRLLQKLGEGGMGEVWEAEQSEPVRRKVALKLIKLGMDTRQVVARFESERQALAMMSHPNIARVFDAGATEQGRPYFVMEHVKGESITAYCDRHRLTNQERLKLFLQVCEGVQHAHQKGIIHRDIKPSNILVSVQDAAPVPKIIDFGVAKATEQRLTEKTVLTQMGVLIGTPEYMSPEQAEMTVLDVDTRTDVYSLGVLLYELLVGALPFDSKELRSEGFEGIRRKIREEEPPKPSARFSTLDDERSRESAARRSVDLPTLRNQLLGDLDWITIRAMEKDRTRRYGSPNDLAADVERYLTEQPVLATPPSAAYKAKKFVRRHRAGVAAGVVVVVVMVMGITGLTVGLLRAQRAEAHARLEAQSAEQVSGFLEGLFEVLDPSEARGGTITAEEILDTGAKRIDHELKDQPLVQARLVGTIGRLYARLGRYKKALPLLERSLTIRRAHLAETHPDVAESLVQLGAYYLDTGALKEAQPLLEEALQIQEATLGPDHPDVAWTLRYLGSLLRERARTVGRYDEARTHLERAVEIWEASLGADHPDLAVGLEHLAVLHLDMGNLEEAEQLFERSLAIREKAHGPYHPDVGSMLTRLGVIAEAQGDIARARTLHERAIDVLQEGFGPDHMYVSYPLLNLGNMLVRTGDYEEARLLIERAATILEAALGPSGSVLALNSLVGLHEANGDPEQALRLLERIVEIREEHDGLESGPLPLALWQLATAYLTVEGDRSKADPLFERALEIVEKANSPDLPPHAYFQACYHALVGERDEAIRYLRRAIEIGYTDHEWFANDPDLNSLHGDPEFEGIVAEVRKRVEQG